MIVERSTRTRLGGRSRAVRAPRPCGTGPEPFNAIRWLQFVVFGICIFKSSVLVEVGFGGNCFFQDGNDVGLKGSCTNGTMDINLGDHQELEFYMEFGYIAENTTVNQDNFNRCRLSMIETASFNNLGSQHFASDRVNYYYPMQGELNGEGFKLKGEGDSDFIQVVEGAPDFEKTWIGYITTVKYLGYANLTTLNFKSFDATEYDPSKDKMPVYLVMIIVVAVLVKLAVIVAAVVGVVWYCVVPCKKMVAAAPGEDKSKTYEGRIEEAKLRAEFLGLPKDPKLHESFLENRSKPKSKKYSVDANAPLKSLTDEQLISTAKSWSPLMDRTQSEWLRTATEAYRCAETRVEFNHPLMVEPKYEIVDHLLNLSVWWQRFDLFFDMPTKIVRQRIIQAKADMMKYRGTFRDVEIRAAIQEDVKDLLAFEQVADQVLATKTGAKKYRLLRRSDKGTSGRGQKDCRGDAKAAPAKKKAILGEVTQKDKDRIKLKTEQINNLLFFEIASRLLGLKTEEPKIGSNAH
ncbi:hypothetical protein M3Y98_00557700 [Aphelenchoides besseyi]|nr:hypothetical protein M3Y98_00557700 [Aphelenchoides besseyi]